MYCFCDYSACKNEKKNELDNTVQIMDCNLVGPLMAHTPNYSKPRVSLCIRLAHRILIIIIL